MPKLIFHSQRIVQKLGVFIAITLFAMIPLVIFAHLTAVTAAPIEPSALEASEIRYIGIVKAKPEGGNVGTWLIGDLSFQATAQTRFQNLPINLNNCVKVEGITENGQFIARSIERRETCNNPIITATLPPPGPQPTVTLPVVELRHLGLVESKPATGTLGLWVIGHLGVVVNNETKLPAPPPNINECVKVVYRPQLSGLIAKEIEREDGCRNLGAPITATVAPPTGTVTPRPTVPVSQTVFNTRGIINSIPVSSPFGTWVISGVNYSAVEFLTRFDRHNGALQIGTCARVIYTQRDADRVMLNIESDRSHECEAEERIQKAFGVIQQLPATTDLLGTWTIGDLNFNVVSRTILSGRPFSVGLTAEVEFLRQPDGTLLAKKIEAYHRPEPNLPNAKVRGLIESRPVSPTINGTWVIASTTLSVTAQTRVEPNLLTGNCAEANYRREGEVNVATNIRRVIDCDPPSANLQARYFGFVQSVPVDGLVGDWVIGGLTFAVSETTRISETNGVVGSGAFVRVRFITDRANNTRKLAISIETLRPPGTGEHTGLGRLAFGKTSFATSLLDAEAAAGNETWYIGNTAYVIADSAVINDQRASLSEGQSVRINAFVDSETGEFIATEVTTIAQNYSLYLPLLRR